MIKRFLLAGVASIAMLTGGCSSLNNIISPQTLQAAETLAQQAAVVLCGFLPTVESVANIIALNNPLLATPEQQANAICASLTSTTPPTAVAGKVGRAGANATVVVSGVTVQGVYVK